jgi:hypothetical protein
VWPRAGRDDPPGKLTLTIPFVFTSWSRFRLSGQLLILWDLNNYAAERTVYDNTEYISVLTGSSFCAGLMFSKGQPTPNSLLRAERWEPWSDMRRYVRQLLWGTVCLFHALFLNG